jgi:hypothetical protein
MQPSIDDQHGVVFEGLIGNLIYVAYQYEKIFFVDSPCVAWVCTARYVCANTSQRCTLLGVS